MKSTTAATIVVSLWLAAPAFAQDSSNVLLVVNEASADSVRIAEYYAKRRSIPSGNILRLRAPVTDDIDRREYERTIEIPVAGWIASHGAHDQILYFVLTKGMPLRVTGSGNAAATTTASVDSELTLLYRKLAGGLVPPAGPLANPYYLEERAVSEARLFSHAAADIYLVSRLDGFTVEDVLALIDRGVNPSTSGRILLDQRATLTGDRSGDIWLATAAKRLTDAGMDAQVVLNSSAGVLTAQQQVLGYYSWGSNDPAIKQRRFGFEFVPGALAAMFVSSDARTFKMPPASWNIGTWGDTSTHFEGSPQSLTGDLIAEGATGAAGHVAEPFLGAAIRPQILFPAYVRGFNLIESFYLAMPYLSWQTVVVGDPLCAPFRKQQLTSQEAAPPVDSDTGLPIHFSSRRVARMNATGTSMDAAKLVAKAEGLMAKGDRDAARSAFEAATTIEPRLPLVHFTLASMYERSGEYEKAIERYRVVLSYAPNDVVALNNLAYALAVRKSAPNDALPYAEQANKLAPANPLIADTLGWIHHLLGRDADAERFLLLAAKNGPRIAAVHLHLAQLYAATGRPEQARVELNASVELDAALKNSPEVQALRKSLLTPTTSGKGQP